MDSVQAVKNLREHFGESQQAFATRLGLSIRAIANYESDRAPTGRALMSLAQAADTAGRDDLANVFLAHLARELGIHTGAGKLRVEDARESGEDASVLTGFLILSRLEGREQFGYAHAFFETFRRFLYPKDQDMKEKATKLLKDFEKASTKAWGTK